MNPSGFKAGIGILARDLPVVNGQKRKPLSFDDTCAGRLFHLSSSLGHDPSGKVTPTGGGPCAERREDFIALHPDDAKDGKKLIRLADNAMYPPGTMAATLSFFSHGKPDYLGHTGQPMRLIGSVMSLPGSLCPVL